MSVHERQNKIKRAVLHVGLEKTGTTSIQQFLRQNHQLLMGDGIYVPVSLGDFNHTKFAISVCNSDRNLGPLAGLKSEDDYIKFRAEVASSFIDEMEKLTDNKLHTLLVSCEWLGHKVTDVVEVSRIKDLLKPYVEEVEVLVYLRRQDKLAISRYSTALKAGAAEPFEFKPKQNIYDFDAICKFWDDNFDKLTVRLFQRSSFAEGDLLADFCSALAVEHIDLDKYSTVQSSNPSLSKEGQLLMLAFNQYIKNNKHNMTMPEIRTIRRELSDHFPGKHNPSNEADAQRFQAKYETINESLRKKYFATHSQLFES